jgi:hypothetical protein
MTKKDYQAIAGAIYSVRVRHPAFSQRVDGETSHDLVVDAIAHVLAAGNPRFDRGRFYEACKTGRCKGMRQVA